MNTPTLTADAISTQHQITHTPASHFPHAPNSLKSKNKTDRTLAIYSRLYDINVPVLCMDEQPVQLVQHTRVPIAATAKHPKRIDYEYKTSWCRQHFHVRRIISELATGLRSHTKDEGRLSFGDGKAAGRTLSRY